MRVILTLLAVKLTDPNTDKRTFHLGYSMGKLQCILGLDHQEFPGHW